MLAPAATFTVAVFLTRFAESWLSTRFPPHTRVDAGVRNSISAVFRYLGMIEAVLLGMAQVGLDCEKLAIIAGALSVNRLRPAVDRTQFRFRPDPARGAGDPGRRLGDGGNRSGVRRRINARATEIETFDRATMIAPNSNLVTGVVKNWVYTDRIGRILVSINFAYESDVEQVRDILIGAAKAQDLIVNIRPPASRSPTSASGRSSSILSASLTTS